MPQAGTGCLILTLISVLFTFRANAQQSAKDSSFNLASARLKANFPTMMGLNAPVYTGAEYEPFNYPITDGTVFYGSTEFITSSLSYLKMFYPELPLKYDLVQNKVLTLYINKSVILQLITDKVDSFTLGNLRFVNLRAAELSNHPAPGFYEILYDGKVKILVRRQKTIERVIKDNTLEYHVHPVNTYYLVRNKVYAEIHSERSMAELLHVGLHRLHAYLRSLHVKYRLEPERALVNMAEFTDTTKN